ncbi:MAG TPA: patatin-like phospholipase family protein [bacterium]
MKKTSVTLALGGGAARGLAHIGVLYELEAQGIQVDRIVGSSIGAIVGALFAIQPSAKYVEEKAREFLTSREFRFTKLEFLRKRDDQSPGFFYNFKSFIMKGILLTSSVTRRGFINVENFQNALRRLVDEYTFEELKIPFAAIAADIQSGEEVIINNGLLVDALVASSAIPGIFSPVEKDGRMLVDGDWISPVPVAAARKLGGEFIVAVDISRDMDDTADLERGLNIMLRTNAIIKQKLKNLELRNADVIIRPEVGEIHWADFTKMSHCIQLGRVAAKGKIEEIKKRARKGILNSLLPKFT